MATISAGPPAWAIDLRAHWARLRFYKSLGRKPMKLIRLSTIGFARWSLLDHVPGGPPGHSPLARPFLVFETNFNGDPKQYLEAFSLVVPNAMNRLWVRAYNVPDVRRTSQWQAYVDKHKLPIAFYHAAYPQASTKMIRTALALEQVLAGFRPAARKMDADSFETGFDKLLALVQRIRNPKVKAASGRSTGLLTTLTPIRGDHRQRLRTDLEELMQPPQAVPADTTHFARWCIVDRLQMPRRFGSDPTSYLLFSSWFDGEPREYAAALYEQLTPARANQIWRNCGFNGGSAEAFADYLVRHSIEPGAPFAAYDGVTVGEIQHALQVAAHFRRFAAKSQSQPLRGRPLRDAWRGDALLSGGP